MKKILTIVSILLCCFLLFACADNAPATDDGTVINQDGDGTVIKPSGEPGGNQQQDPPQDPGETEATIDVYVTFSNAGVLEMKQEKVTVTDLNGDDKFTAEEAIRAFHAAKNKEFELNGGYITKIWSISTGNCMYYINNEMAYSIDTEMADGDYLNAYIIKDTTAWSDSYTFFTEHAVEATAGEEVMLTVKNLETDANWNTSKVATAGAKITIDGEEGEFTTDEDGKVTLSFENVGTYVVVASSDTMNLVPTVCVVTVKPVAIDVYVTFSNAGVLEMKQEKITVTDLNNDKTITAEEAIRAFHAAKNKEFALSEGFITKIWSVETGNCMYYINDEMAYSINAEMADGDYLNAYIIKDTVAWSDSYTIFTERTVEATAGEEVVLTVKNTELDDQWNASLVPTAGAVITVDGKEGEFVTNENGNVTLTFASAGTYVIVASNDTMSLVPAVCVVTVK